MRLTHPTFISALISFIIAFIHFASAESAPSSYPHGKNVTANHTLGHGEVATQPGHILAEKNKISRGLAFPSDHELLQSIIGFATLMNCRFSNTALECYEDFSADVQLYKFGTSFRNVLNCRLAPEGELCAENNGADGLSDAIAVVSSYVDAPTPTFKVAVATVIGTEMITTTGTVTNTATYLAAMSTSTDVRGSTVTSTSTLTSTRTSTGTLTTPSMYTRTKEGQLTEVPTLAKLRPTKRSTPMMKRVDELQLDANTTRKGLSDEDAGEIITIVLGTILGFVKKVMPGTNASTTALAGSPSSSDAPIPSATPVPVTKRSIPAAITQDPHTPSATAAPTSSANISPILGDDLLSGGLVSEEPSAVDGAVDGQLEETATLVPGNGQVGKISRRRARYNGAELARMMI